MPGDWTGERYDMKVDVPARVVDRITEYIGILSQMFVLAMVVVAGALILKWLFRLLLF